MTPPPALCPITAEMREAAWQELRQMQPQASAVVIVVVDARTLPMDIGSVGVAPTADTLVRVVETHWQKTWRGQWQCLNPLEPDDVLEERSV